ncbi:hypothetical protein TPB0596_17590 [Tsukamurella pulmonis]|uniref:N-acetyltransferase domain-containing protein n=2 Tax=Tsukamurella pulmonis TaxID=47312 RepID=A0A1H1G3J2_9ACTN|nr:hypothetical protein [Tsukamurella pulmonis]KXO87814.1 hypothetical protein AXK56_15650 [Tsukamurella pulmonis]KXP13580.1 hypothetical protein AXK57_05245 [Tsukamurella pulmonis]SDR07812.1 hypothetical protein SAMN04489765_3087 [Tsukamurella pulmonis]SUP17933.1 Uncharacterised protein [Tsukamurella pulmonis]BDD81996.1 hypothetical protein TPB0596_17590 [Tsukamurella pulmonis]
MNDSPLTLRRADDGDWLAVDGDGRLIGRGGPARRAGYVSIDAWSATAFDLLAATLLAELPSPSFTLVADCDRDLLAAWRRHGFAPHRRETLYRIPLDPPPAVSPPGAWRVRSAPGVAPFLAVHADPADAAAVAVIERAGGVAVETCVELVRR